MSFLPLHRDKEHKFKNGHWTWGENEAKLKFHSHDDDKQTKQKLCGLLDAGLKFAEYINVAEEKILREVFLRSEKFYDSEVVTLQDIKILAFFTMKSKATRKLIEFLHTQTFDKFLHGTIFYIDMYLLILEYLLIRRDKEEKGKIRDMYSIQIEQQLSKQLSDRRLLIAREYSKILLMPDKSGSQSTFQSRPTSEKDLHFYESMIDFTIQCTFIAMYRRGFNAISCELNRLFRTEFFNVARNTSCFYQFTFRERQILHGLYNYKNSLKNFRHQMSPLMAELLIPPSNETSEVLKIGEEKYFGFEFEATKCSRLLNNLFKSPFPISTSKYLFHLELEFTVPECHLFLIGQRRGILGHPKALYDTMLNLNEQALRKMAWSEDYDPYGLIKRAFIKIHTSEDFAERRKNLSTRLIIQREPYGGVENQLNLWKQKESIIKRNIRQSLID